MAGIEQPQMTTRPTNLMEPETLHRKSSILNEAKEADGTDGLLTRKFNVRGTG